MGQIPIPDGAYQSFPDDLSMNDLTQKEHCKKMLLIFPSPTGMSLTKLSLDRKNLIIPRQGEFGY
jgi:hypothetical protein